MPNYQIAIDGPSGAGKSTIAKRLAAELNIMYLDTGAMYRALALKALNQNIDCKSPDAVLPMLKDTRLEVRYFSGRQSVILDGEDVGGAIRRHEISGAASNISAIPEVRLYLVDIMRNIAASNSLVMDGRDIGTFVLPDARFKFYVTADAEERARRRQKELKERGEDADFNTLLKDINTRDHNDMNRAFAPLKRAEDARLIDTTKMNIDEVTLTMLDIIRGSEEEAAAYTFGRERKEKPAGEKSEKNTKEKRKKVKFRDTKFCRFLQACALIFWFIASYPWFFIMQNTKVFNRKRFIRGRKIIYVANHLSYLDPIMVIHKFPSFKLHALAKKELSKTPLILVCWAINLIYVDRENPGMEAIMRCMRILRNGEELLLYPEGTRNKTGTTEIQEIKDGAGMFALRCEAPLQPVINSDKYRPFHKCYMYVGKEFDLSEFYGKKVTPELSAQINKRIRDEMIAARAEMLIEIDLHKNRRKYRKMYKAAKVSGDYTGIPELFVERAKAKGK